MKGRVRDGWALFRELTPQTVTRSRARRLRLWTGAVALAAIGVSFLLPDEGPLSRVVGIVLAVLLAMALVGTFGVLSWRPRPDTMPNTLEPSESAAVLAAFDDGDPATLSAPLQQAAIGSAVYLRNLMTMTVYRQLITYVPMGIACIILFAIQFGSDLVATPVILGAFVALNLAMIPSGLRVLAGTIPVIDFRDRRVSDSSAGQTEGD